MFGAGRTERQSGRLRPPNGGRAQTLVAVCKNLGSDWIWFYQEVALMAFLGIELSQKECREFRVCRMAVEEYVQILQKKGHIAAS
jgi:hypothetical protein